MGELAADRRAPLHLIVGTPADPLAAAVAAELRDRGREADILSNPLLGPGRVAWRLSTDRSTSRIAIGDEDGEIEDREIASVLVRGPGLVDAADWTAADAAYMQSESGAGLLAWVWGLDCPVVNRLPAWIWFRPRQPLAAWQRHLHAAGLRSAEVLVTNVEVTPPRFDAQGGGNNGHGQVMHTPLTGSARFVASSDDDWSRLSRVQEHVPLVLSAVPAEPRAAWVVGERVLWEARTADRALDEALIRLARACSVDILRVTVDVATRSGEPEVLAVDPAPSLDPVAPERRGDLVGAIADVMEVRA
jgi:hypothetical protein